MSTSLHELSIPERIRLVEDLWDSIAEQEGALPLTPAQRAELDQRLDAFEIDGNAGRPAHGVIASIRQKL
jgi:putative addiction module component (TIGR02574 family)